MLHESHDNRPSGGDPRAADAPLELRRGEVDEASLGIDLVLQVRDPDLVEELMALPSDRERERFALSALRIGVLSLRTARGQVDAQTVQGEVERMLRTLEKDLTQHRDTLQVELGAALREYFDPKSGRFAERVQALTREDGELAGVIRSHVEGAESPLGQTLLQHLGQDSPLLRALDPSNAEGLLLSVQRGVDEALGTQRERLLAEFSLDNREGSLFRLVTELTENHGQLSQDLQGRIDSVVKEFSLDHQDSALSRLVHRVERAQQQIAEEFTLDSETSALARLRREMMGVAERQSETLHKLEKRMATELAALTARREAERRGTTHGHTFETALLAHLRPLAERAGDVFSETGHTTGLIRNRRVGDAVVELGPDQRAAGSRIVIEAKEDASYDVAQARAELDLARRNRGAEVGLFVLSARVAPESWRRFFRIGEDVFAVWDADDPTSDVYVDAGLSLARSLCTRARGENRSDLDLTLLERAIRDVEKQADGLDEIHSASGTIENSTKKIRERVRKMRANLMRSVTTLDECHEAVREELGAPPSDA